MRGIGVVRKQEAIRFDDVANELNAGTFEFLGVGVPELGATGLGLVGVSGFSGTELVDAAAGLGAEAVLLALLEGLPEAVLWKLELG